LKNVYLYLFEKLSVRLMIDKHVDRLEDLLTNVIRNAVEGVETVGISYSGGLDCSVIAKIASNYTNVKLYTVGTDTSQDIVTAKSGSEYLNLHLELIRITGNDVQQAVPNLIEILKSRNALEISIELSLYFVCKNAKEELILTGQGADELFGGYSRYLRMEPTEREHQMRQDVARYIQYNKKQEQKLAEAFNKKLVTTYMAPSTREFIEGLPMDLKIYRNERKYLLKALARKLGLSSTIVDRPKKAVQYGTGILSELKGLAKKEGFELHEYLLNI
jgi:asparagine synthase (glutamine-hydrolysing)